MALLRLLVLLSGMIAWACSGSSGDGQTNSTPLSCGQTCQDDQVGYAIDSTMWLLWNENIAGQASGSKNLTVTCPLGGSAQVTGTTGMSSNGIDTIHLTFNLQDCANSGTYYSLAFSGTLTWDGTFSSSSANALTFKSSALTISGTVKLYDKPMLSETCSVSLTDTYNANVTSKSAWLIGEICSRTVSQ